MRENHAIKSNKLIIFITLLLSSISYTSFGQNINIIVSQNQLPQLDDRAIVTSNAISLQLLNPKLLTGQVFKLGLTIEGKGIVLKSAYDFFPDPISIDGSPITYLNSVDLAPYFDIDNLDFYGYSKEDYEQYGGLPDGAYTVCFQLYNNTSDAYFATGQKSCAYMWVKREDPPRITTPVRKPVIDNRAPYHVTWMPRHTAVSFVQYEMEIYENNVNMTYQDIMLYHSPVIKQNIPSTQYIIQSNNSLLKLDREYFVIVRAYGNNINFKNGGYSEPEFFVYGKENLRAAEKECPLPSGKVFINEISQGCFDAGEGSQEYIELVVVGQADEEFVNLENYIIDDNNYSSSDEGNEPGHIRLGECFNRVPKGTIILIYNNDDLNPLIKSIYDGMPGIGGWWQVPFDDRCLKRFSNCPDQINDGYDCGQLELKVTWENYIPMRNTNDVLQIRDQNEGLEHAIIWVTDSYEYNSSNKTVRINNISTAQGKTFAFVTGTDWNDENNWVVNTCEGGNQSTPGVPNSDPNWTFIDKLKKSVSNDFYISCAPTSIPANGATVDVHLSSPNNNFHVYLDGGLFATSNTIPYILPNLSQGNHVILIIELETGCEAECIVEVSCNVGSPCDDGDECTVNDVINSNCICKGVQNGEVDFIITNTCVPQELINLDWGFDCCPGSTVAGNYNNGSNCLYLGNCSGWLVTNGSPDSWLPPLSLSPNMNTYSGLSEGMNASPQGGVFLGAGAWLNAEGFKSSSFTTIPGQIYTITFFQAFAGNGPQASEGDRTQTGDQACWSVRFGNQYPQNSPIETYVGAGQQTWNEVTMTFVAQSASSELKFNCNKITSGNNNKYYMAIDDVRITGGNENCIIDSIKVTADCEISNYLWSNGTTTNSIKINGGETGACYGVTVTCTNGCTYEAVYGENCECIIGTPCPGDVPCTNFGVYDNQCNCPDPLPFLDFDQDGICDDVDPCIVGMPCDDGDPCSAGDMISLTCNCQGEPLEELTFVTDGTDSLCNYCSHFFYPCHEIPTKSLLNSLTLQDKNGVIYNLNDGTNGMNFPYCHVSPVGTPAGQTDCTNSSLIFNDFVNDLNEWIINNGYRGTASLGETQYCEPYRGINTDTCNYRLLITETDLHFINLNYDYWWTNILGTVISDLNNNNWFEGPNDCKTSQDTVKVMVDCEGPIIYQWSTGATTQNIYVGDGAYNACYGVTVTCGNGCIYEGIYGENCGCIVGTPCPGEDPCLYYGNYDHACNCITPLPLPDSDIDGVCDELDICPGEDDLLDFDQDGIKDCLDTLITCEFFEASLAIDTILPGTCNYSINFDSLLGSNDFININKILISQGTENFEIEHNLPFCYSLLSSNAPVSVFNDGFENNQWGNWYGYPEDAKLVKEHPNSGQYSLRIRDNSNFSFVESSQFFINNFSFIKGEFSMLAEGFTNPTQKFILEVSFDNGITYQLVDEWYYGIDFENNIRKNYGFTIQTNQNKIAKIRIRTDYVDFGDQTNFDNSKLYFDDLRVEKLLDNCINNLSGLVPIIQNWLINNNFNGLVSVSSNTSTNACQSPGNKLIIEGSNVSFNGLLYSTESFGSQEAFCSWDCTGSVNGDTSYIVRAIANCKNPFLLWSDGSTADSLMLLSLNGQLNVMVACHDCDTTLLFGGSGCIPGTACFDYTNCIYGEYDINCNCVGEIIQDDYDNDGILDCFDLCFDCPLNDANSNGICDCYESCPPLDSLTFLFTPVSEETCDYCLGINHHDQMLNNVILIDSLGNAHSLDTSSVFNFPYCGSIDQSTCDINNVEIYSLKRFVSDFYFWYSQHDENFRFAIGVDTFRCDENYLFTITLENTKIDQLKLIFDNAKYTANEVNCFKHIIGHNVSLDLSNLINCDDPDFLWSNGSEQDSVFVHDLNFGYSVTVTCSDSCSYTDNTVDNPLCIIGGPCNDGNLCTINDRYTEECICTGDKVADTDEDTVCDSLDICAGYSDLLDDDRDGIPNGCDSCFVFQNLCDYCVDLPSNKTCINVAGFVFKDSLGNEIPVIWPWTQIGGNCLLASSAFANQIQGWLINNNYNGNVRYEETTCQGLTPGYSILITETDLEFVMLNVKEPVDYNFTLLGCKDKSMPKIGLHCDDGDPCTIRDSIDQNCNCKGIYMDSDNDTVCDINDQCEGWPDHLDANGNGMPDGCDDLTFVCNNDQIPFCEYFRKISQCDNQFQPVPLISLQDTLLKYLQDSAFNLPHFYIPELIENLMSGDDEDNDGIINILDPCPNKGNTPLTAYTSQGDSIHFFCASSFSYNGNSYKSDFADCCDESIDKKKASLLAYFFFNPGNTILENDGNIIYYPLCAVKNSLKDRSGFWYQDKCRVNINVNCNCECEIEYANNVDKDTICDEIDIVFGDTCTLVCPLNLDKCEICNVVANPLYDAFNKNSGPPCMIVIDTIIDTDHDGVCDLYDLCPGTAADSIATGGPLPEFDDSTDINGNGIPACLDPCDGFDLSQYQREGYEIPVGFGDVCDDGNPCTYSDTISIDCQCHGIPVDIDSDNIFDCSECKIYQLINNNYVEISSYGPFESNGDYLITGGAPVVGAKLCDVCPDLDDRNDYNDNGIPDCLDPPYYPIGCPDTILLLTPGGLVLTFDSDDIKLEDLPEPVELTFQAGPTAGYAQIINYPYLKILNVREVDGVFEVLYGIPDLPYSNSPSFIGVSYAGHQNCVNGNPTDLISPRCPSNLNILPGKIRLQIDFGNTGTPDISKLYENYTISGSYGVLNTPINANLAASNISEANTNLFDLTFDIANIHPDSNVVINSIMLSNGTVCNYSGGTIQTPIGCDPNIPGSPCDDGDPCTHHDRYVYNGTTCTCTGDPKPDKDGDEICDELDPCPDVPNTGPDNNSDGYPDCPCPMLVIDSSSLVSGSDFTVNLKPDSLSMFTGFTITISGGPDGVISRNAGITMPLVVANLPKGYPLTITITGNGANGCSTTATEEVDVPFDTDPAFCGISLSDFNMDNAELVQSLVPDDVFRAYDFDVVVQKAQGGIGRFTGKGFIEVPYFNLVRLNVKFDNILLSNIDNVKTLRSGFVEIKGLGQNVIGDDVIGIIEDIIPILETLDDLIENITDIVEGIEELIETTGTLVDPSLVECMNTAKANLEALANDPNATQAQLNQAKQALQDCKDAYKAALSEMLNHILIVLNGNATINGIINDYANCDQAYEQSEYLAAKGFLNTRLLADSTTYVGSLDLTGQGTSGLTNGNEKVSSKIISETEIDVSLMNLIKTYYKEEVDYQLCIAFTKLTTEIQSLEQANQLLQLIVEAGNDFLPIVGPEINANKDANGIVNYSVVIQNTKEAFRDVLVKLLLHKGYKK